VTVVLDTNVLVAAMVAEGLCREVVHRAARLRLLVSSRPLLDELDRTLARKFASTTASAAFMKALRDQVPLVEPTVLPSPVSREPDDDVVIATAVAAGAAMIVTGDDDLLVLKKYGDVAIVSSRQFLELLDSGY
jgi:putative PIN family toxin of toxin-antitoxin system